MIQTNFNERTTFSLDRATAGEAFALILSGFTRNLTRPAVSAAEQGTVLASSVSERSFLVRFSGY
jgi:hypothetical protein